MSKMKWTIKKHETRRYFVDLSELIASPIKTVESIDVQGDDTLIVGSVRMSGTVAEMLFRGGQVSNRPVGVTVKYRTMDDRLHCVEITVVIAR